MDPGHQRVAIFAALCAVIPGAALLGLWGMVLARLGIRRMSPGERKATLAALALSGVGLACLLWGLFGEADWLEVTHQEVHTAKLPRGTRLRIVHLSDLHVDAPTRALRALPGIVAAQHPDLVVFTGDALNRADGLALFRDLLGGMEAPLGRFAVRGNHDTWYWSRFDLFGGGVATELSGDTPVALSGHGVALCGSPYGVTGSLETCLRKARGQFRLVAYHTPDLVQALQTEPPDLYLAGHTHGGQVRLPLYGALITLSAFDKAYEMGRYQVGPTTLHVSRGIGFEGQGPRVRFLCRPEVAVIDVVGTGR